MNDHDLLVEINVKLGELSKQFSNHIRHHQKITITMVVIAGAFVAAGLARLLPWPF